MVVVVTMICGEFDWWALVVEYGTVLYTVDLACSSWAVGVEERVVKLKTL